MWKTCIDCGTSFYVDDDITVWFLSIKEKAANGWQAQNGFKN